MAFKIFRKNCCGLDVHKTWLYACIGITDPNGRTEYKQARFSSEGICADVRMNLLGGTLNIRLADAEGNEHRLVIGKDHKIRTGLSYRFYFRDSDSISPGRNPLLKKALLTDNLLGVEEMK